MSALFLELILAAAVAIALGVNASGAWLRTGADASLPQPLFAGFIWLAPALVTVWLLAWLVRLVRAACGAAADRLASDRALVPLLLGYCAAAQPFFTWFPLALPLLAIALAAIAWRLFREFAASEAGTALWSRAEHALGGWGAVRTAALAAAPLFLLQLSIISGLWSSLPQPEGDEPQYLVISWSLLTDGDQQLLDDYRAQDYRRWHEGWMQAHTKAGSAGMSQQYSMHNIALAVWLVPFLWLGLQFGSAAAIIFCTRLGIVILASLFFFLLCLLLQRLSGRRLRSLLLTILCGVTAPCLFFSWHLFTELPAALVCLAAFSMLWREQSPAPLMRILAGLSIAVLPWLGVKYFALALPFCLLWLAQEVRWGFRPFRVLQVAAPGAALGLLFFWNTWLLFGTLSPSAYYLGAQGSLVEKNIVFKVSGASGPLEAIAIPAKTVLSYFIDQREGILFYAPWYLIALAAALTLVRRNHPHRRLFFWLLCIGLPFIVLYSLTGFGGGHSPPARSIAPVAWMFVLALGVSDLRGFLKHRTLAAVLVTLSIAISIVLLLNPSFLYHDFNVPAAHLLTWLSSPFADATKLFPSVNSKHFELWAVTLAWSVAALGALTVLMKKTPLFPGRFHGVATLVAAAALIAWGAAMRTPPLQEYAYTAEDASFTVHFERGMVFNDPGAFWVKTASTEFCYVVSPAPLDSLSLRVRAVAPTKVWLDSEIARKQCDLHLRRQTTVTLPLSGGFQAGGGFVRRFSVESIGGNPAGIDIGNGERRPLGAEIMPLRAAPSTPIQ